VNPLKVLLENDSVGVLELLRLHDGDAALRVGKGSVGLAVAAVECQRFLSFCDFRSVRAATGLHVPE
jgi:hypothetical protein